MQKKNVVKLFFQPLKIFSITIFIALYFLSTNCWSLKAPHYASNGIGCDNCHGAEGPASSPTVAKTPEEQETLCRSCHYKDGPASSREGLYQIALHTVESGGETIVIRCGACHDPHGPTETTDPHTGQTADNQFLIRANINDYVPQANGSAVYQTNVIPEEPNTFTFTEEPYTGICQNCHQNTDHWLNSEMEEPPHNYGRRCIDCHAHSNGFLHGYGAQGAGAEGCAFGSTCHATVQAHPTHLSDQLGDIHCSQCHDYDNIPTLADGKDFATTTVCETCHSTDGAVIAKQYWEHSGSPTGEADTWRAVEGDQSYCGSCHDDTPGTVDSLPAPNIAGDNTTYGFFVTGHGRTAATGDYERLSWQDDSASGNPPAERQCSDCHDLTSLHIGSNDSRLKPGFENDATNSNCNNCHTSAGMATADPQYYTSSDDFELSAHGSDSRLNPLTGNPVLCTNCHDVHGASGTHKAMTRADGENLCFQCHKDPAQGGIENLAISGSDVADDIEQAFSYADSNKHNMGTSFTLGSNNYTLECVTCHNVHLVSGKYLEADQNKSPITRISKPGNPQGNLEVWGDGDDEKMDDHGGTYRTPTGDLFSAWQLPDYASFCLECHAEPGSAPFGIDWVGRPHGLQSADGPAGFGICPNWYGCGKAEGWDGDSCISDQETCWPTMTRGKGDQIWTRKPYNHEDRIAGANFTLSCTDCHEAHGSTIRSMIRSNPNGGTGTTVWNTMCDNCHYYYSDWHAGMSCGNASCHVSDSIHRIGSYTGSGPTRSFDSDLVLHYAFENNLNDSGDWQMHGQWMDDITGAYAPGQSGQAAVFAGGMNVQVGTENEHWSTDGGYHGTHIYTDMKYNTTLEAWIYPTDNANSEYSLFTKHVGYANGGYGFSLKQVGDSYRAAFNMQADSNAGDTGGASGIRGAYSSVPIPLNTWSHVAATFDTSGTDRNTNDPTQGRIRIYVNGEDATTSDSSGSFMQPAAGETSIYAFVENSDGNESICYNGIWCTSEFSIGGFYGWQNEFIGRIDEAKVWNITKDATYFAPIDGTVAPLIVSVSIDTPNRLLVSFSEGVVGSGTNGELIPSDFVLSASGITILSVVHQSGDSTAQLILSGNLTSVIIATATLSATNGAIIDNYNLAAGTDPISISGSLCPTVASFQMNEAACSTAAQDADGILTGTVNDSCTTFTGDGSFHGDGDAAGNNFIDYLNADDCMISATALTIETRIKPTGIGTGNYIRRIIAKDSSSTNYQVSVWRNNNWTEFNAPDGTASIAMWVPPVDTHGGDGWKVLKTDYTACPIVSDHWYQVKVVWNSAKTGGIPGDIFVDDQGTDGLGAGEGWTNYINCTDSSQTQTPATKYFLEGDQIQASDSDMRIGANGNNSANNHFEGLIDWITVKTEVDYTGVDGTPNPPQP